MTSAAWRGPRAPGPTRLPVSGTSTRLAPRIYDVVKERLLEGGYNAGERVAVEALKTEFGVSKQPIMDALRRLESDGLVEIIPQVGCRVPIYGPQDVADFFAVFAGMEGAVAGVAAQRYQAAQLRQLIAINASINDLAQESDPADRAHGYRLLNREFHALIHTMAHSPVVAEISRRMWDRSDLLINTSGVSQPLASAVAGRHEDHDRIIEAFRDRDQRRARDEMEAHIVGTVAVIHAEAQLPSITSTHQRRLPPASSTTTTPR